MTGQDDNIGYGKPPKQTRFKKGQSGNPKGRPPKKGALSHEIVEKVLNQKILIREDGKEKKLTKLEAYIMSTLSQSIKKGDPKLLKTLITLGYFTKDKDGRPEGVIIIRDTTLEDPNAFKPLPGEPGYSDEPDYKPPFFPFSGK